MNIDVPVTEVEFVAFDFETTGLHSASDRIVEFGAVRFSGSEMTVCASASIQMKSGFLPSVRGWNQLSNDAPTFVAQCR